MNMLDIHQEAMGLVNEAHHTFLLRYRKDKKIVFGIVEGKDDPMFYRSVIERFLPEDWNVDLIPAGGRDRVIDIYEMLDWNSFSPHHVAFFIDRDLGNLIPLRGSKMLNVYITDGYSIENDIVTPKVAERILIESYNIVDLNEHEMGEVVNAFNEQVDEFKRLMVPIMAQILGWRRDGVDANLNNINLSNIFMFDNCKIKYNTKYIGSASLIKYVASCVGAPQYDESQIADLTSRFLLSKGSDLFTRGKYLIWFMAKILSDIHKNISSFTALYTKPPKVKIELGPANLMVIAAPRARAPASLQQFVEETYIAYIRAAVSSAECCS